MTTLFLDSSYYLTLGLLNDNWEWKAYRKICKPKSSSEIHQQLDLMLTEEMIDVQKIDQVIYIAGPGSYTGMRIGHGVAECFALLDKPIYSFYHFQVPRLLGISEGVWFSSAFKGEYFFYRWKDDESSQQLFGSLAFKEQLNHQNKTDFIFSYFGAETEFSHLLPEGLIIKDSATLIYEKVKELMPEIISRKLKEATFYYRSLTEEFKTIDGK